MVITVGNYKGGVGKTRTAITLGAALVRRGLKVLLIDFDGQRNATTSTVGPVQETEDSKHVVSWMKVGRHTSFQETVFANVEGWGFDLIPGSMNMDDFDAQFKKIDRGIAREYVLRNALERDRLKTRYDVIIIDTAPAADSALMTALIASDELLIASTVNGESVDGASTIVELARGIRNAYNLPLITDGALFTMAQTHYKSVLECKAVAIERFEAAGVYCYEAVIRLSTAGNIMSWGNQDICTVLPQSNISVDYEEFADEWLSRHRAQLNLGEEGMK